MVPCFIITPAFSAEKSTRTKFPQKVIPGRFSLICKKVTVPPKMDGEVDKDPVWQQCDRTKGAWVELGTKRKSVKQTVVFTCYDDKNLYFGFVCEERDLSKLCMDGSVDALRNSADSVEVALEVGGLQGKGDTYVFRANELKQFQAWGFEQVPSRQRKTWEHVVKYGPNRWMLEMKIPFSALQRKMSSKKLLHPKPQDLCGIKLLRYDAKGEDGRRMTSTLNSDIPFKALYLCGHNGLLWFDDEHPLGVQRLEEGKPPLGKWCLTNNAETEKNIH